MTSEPLSPPSNPRLNPWLLWGIVFVIVGGMVVGWNYVIFSKRALDRLPIKAPLDYFEGVRASGEAVTSNDLTGKVWVASFVFTRCPDGCVPSAAQLKLIEEKFTKAGDRFKIVSFTLDPEFDTADRLKAWADNFRGDPNRWWFLTGDPRKFKKLIHNKFKIIVQQREGADKDPTIPPYAHDPMLVLVDQKLRIRGYYRILSDPYALDRINAHIEELLKNPA